MSQLKKIVLVVVSIVVLGRLSYAEIEDINNTGFSTAIFSRGLLNSSPSHTSESEGVACGEITATTPDGCNEALGVSSGATATPCDGGLYTCSIQPIAYADAIACHPDAFDVDDTTPGQMNNYCNYSGYTNSYAQLCGPDSSKFNCVCDAAVFNQTCSGGTVANPDAAGYCKNTKNETFVIDTDTECINPCPETSIFYQLNSDCPDDQAKIECYVINGENVEHQTMCDRRCDTIIPLFPQYNYPTTSGNSACGNDFKGVIVNGNYCFDDDAINTSQARYACRCNSNNGYYPYEFDQKPNCNTTFSGERSDPNEVCTAENKQLDDGTYVQGYKYKDECVYTTCTDTDMTMINTIHCNGHWRNDNCDNTGLCLQGWCTGASGSAYISMCDSQTTENTCEILSTRFVSSIKAYATDGVKSLYGGKAKYVCRLNNKALCEITTTNLTYNNVPCPTNSSGNNDVYVDAVWVNTCEDEYQYVPHDTHFSEQEIADFGLTKCAEDEVPTATLSSPNRNICIWDSQTSIKDIGNNSSENGRIETLDTQKFRYSNGCYKMCTAAELAMPEATSCPSGAVPIKCAKSGEDYTININTSGLNNLFTATVSIHPEHSYCGCPLDAQGNITYFSSCQNNEVLGGDSCQHNGTDTYYEQCLPQCYGFEGTVDPHGFYTTDINNCPIESQTTVGSDTSVRYSECFKFSDPTLNTDIKYQCHCSDEYKTLEQWCADNSITEGCDTTTYAGVTSEGLCQLDRDASGTLLTKYKNYARACPTEDAYIIDAGATCPNVTIGEICLQNGVEKQWCHCPDTYKTQEECQSENKVAGGSDCLLNINNAIVYEFERCLPQCQGSLNGSDASVAGTYVTDITSCPSGSVASATDDECYPSQSPYQNSTPMYQCQCTDGYESKEEFCGVGDNGSQTTFTADSDECMNRQIQCLGTPCNIEGVEKCLHNDWKFICPADRALADNQSDCNVGGSFDYECINGNSETKSVCKCASAYKTDSECGANEEGAGQQCLWDSNTAPKYEKCLPTCASVISNGSLNTTFATQADCQADSGLGAGATWGVNGETENNQPKQCSTNHVSYTPCYCGAAYSETCTTNNQEPVTAEDYCKINNVNYYTACQYQACPTPSSTTAVIEIDASETNMPAAIICSIKFGGGSSGSYCGSNKVECSCDANTYNQTCEYPLQPPAGDGYCRHGDVDGTNMSISSPQYYSNCDQLPTANLDDCGTVNLGDGIQYNVYVASTEQECHNLYGNSISTRICKYPNQPTQTAYNCYYSASEYKWTMDNCPVRRILGGDYIIVNGVRYYQKCDCHPAYKHHTNNCTNGNGTLQGSSCEQEVTMSLKSTIANLGAVGTPVKLYTTCSCPPEYTQTCDGDHMTGVGNSCGGKYVSCQCNPDPMPDSWVNNYYGCPGGQTPTGVFKPDGCGGKYYQCEAKPCTWQHTKVCPSPLEGIDGCEDNEGNVVAYKSCQCPSEYDKTCSNPGEIGIGEPCILNGVAKYKNCSSALSSCNNAPQTCSGQFQIGVNPCLGNNGVTAYESCMCLPEYDKTCSNPGETGVGSFCEINGVKKYTSCAPVAGNCTPEHQAVCDINQTPYDPCTDSNQQILYKCKCPSNYSACEDEGPAADAETCTDSNGTVYSTCEVSNACTPQQENQYVICNDFSQGLGGSCVDTNGQTKYAYCQSTMDCAVNGYVHTCYGYSGMPNANDFCTDENNNKLYKECQCPTTYTACGANNEKSGPCIPTLPNGTQGQLLWASCSCNDTAYPYECTATSENHIIGSGQFCSYPDASNGQMITKYESCACSDGYSFTCTGNGQQVLQDSNDYCQLPGQSENGRTYSACQCAPQYDEICPTSQGYDMSSENNFCVEQPSGQKKYISCTCNSNFAPCNTVTASPEGLNLGVDYCIEGSEFKYTIAACQSFPELCEYTETCVSTGGNHIQGGGNSCLIYDADNQPQTRYQSCVCENGYNQTCTAPQIPVDENNYCQLTDGGPKKYSSCTCPAEYITCSTNLGHMSNIGYNSCVDNDGTTKSAGCICKTEFQVCEELNNINNLTEGTDYCIGYRSVSGSSPDTSQIRTLYNTTTKDCDYYINASGGGNPDEGTEGGEGSEGTEDGEETGGTEDDSGGDGNNNQNCIFSGEGYTKIEGVTVPELANSEIFSGMLSNEIAEQVATYIEEREECVLSCGCAIVNSDNCGNFYYKYTTVESCPEGQQKINTEETVDGWREGCVISICVSE